MLPEMPSWTKIIFSAAIGQKNLTELPYVWIKLGELGCKCLCRLVDHKLFSPSSANKRKKKKKYWERLHTVWGLLSTACSVLTFIYLCPHISYWFGCLKTSKWSQKSSRSDAYDSLDMFLSLVWWRKCTVPWPFKNGTLGKTQEGLSPLHQMV